MTLPQQQLSYGALAVPTIQNRVVVASHVPTPWPRQQLQQAAMVPVQRCTASVHVLAEVAVPVGSQGSVGRQGSVRQQGREQRTAEEVFSQWEGRKRADAKGLEGAREAVKKANSGLVIANAHKALVRAENEQSLILTEDTTAGCSAGCSAQGVHGG